MLPCACDALACIYLSVSGHGLWEDGSHQGQAYYGGKEESAGLNTREPSNIRSLGWAAGPKQRQLLADEDQSGLNSGPQKICSHPIPGSREHTLV